MSAVASVAGGARGRLIDDRAWFDRPSVEVAPDLLGSILIHDSHQGRVAGRIVEVEAYQGPEDLAAHSSRGQTERNAVMFGPPGHVYVYFTYGMHFCMNLVCGPEGTSSAVLLRAGEIIAGEDIARARRPRSTVRDLGRGPARLCQALGIAREQNGLDVCAPGGEMTVLRGVPADPALIRSGPRTGVNGAKEVPWRFWIDGDPTVSPYRPHVPRQRKNVPAGGR